MAGNRAAHRAADGGVCGVFFDLCGTLLVFSDERAAHVAWRECLRRHLDACARQQGAAGPWHEAFAARIGDLFDKPEPPPDGDGLTVHERRLRALCAELGLRPTVQQLHRAADESLDVWRQHAVLDPAALPVLRALRPRVKLALVSNFDHPPFVHELLRTQGLRPLFDAVVVSGDVGVCKPDPRIFRHALAPTGLAPEEVTYVGDARVDAEGARAAGIRPVIIRRDGLPLGPEFLPARAIRSLREVEAIAFGG